MTQHLWSVFLPLFVFTSPSLFSHTHTPPPHTNTHTLPAVSHLSVSLSVVIDLCSGQWLMDLWGTQASLHTNSVNSLRALKLGLWSKNCWQVSGHASNTAAHTHNHPPHRPPASAVEGYYSRWLLLLHTDVFRCECVRLCQVEQDVWSTPYSRMEKKSKQKDVLRLRTDNTFIIVCISYSIAT